MSYGWSKKDTRSLSSATVDAGRAWAKHRSGKADRRYQGRSRAQCWRESLALRASMKESEEGATGRANGTVAAEAWSLSESRVQNRPISIPSLLLYSAVLGTLDPDRWLS